MANLKPIAFNTDGYRQFTRSTDKLEFYGGIVVPDYDFIVDYPQSTTTGSNISITAQQAAFGFTGGNVTIQAGIGAPGGDAYLLGGDGSVVDDGYGGDAIVGGGAGSGSGRAGNVAIHAAPVSWNNGSKIMFLEDSDNIPDGNPTGGGYMYSESGAGKWRGTSGTISTFGPADPHCPRCGKDYALEWENETYQEHLAICVPCMLSTLEKNGISRDNFIITKK